MRIGVLGTGVIASAVVRGIADDGHQITVSRRSAARSKALARDHAAVSVADNQGVVDQSDVIFLGLMAEQAGDILGALSFRPEQRVISFMAGASLEEVEQLVVPARAVAIMMPFPGIATGGSPILMQGDPTLIREIFGARNTVFALGDSAEMQAYLCAQAVLSPVAAMVGAAADWLGARVEDRGEGEAFLRALVASSLAGAECGDLIETLNTPGGYNQRLRHHMEDSGMGAALFKGMDRLESGD